jgi:hypothetical protein
LVILILLGEEYKLRSSSLCTLPKSGTFLLGHSVYIHL